MKLFGAIVVDKDMEGEHITKSEKSKTLREKGRHGRVVEGEDGDSLAMVDLISEMCLCKVFIEGGEFRVFFKDFGNVKSSGGGSKEDNNEESEDSCRHRWLHCVVATAGVR